MPSAAPPIDIRNRMAAAGWAFMAVWLGMLVLFTWILARDGAHPSQPAWVQHGAIAFFWLIGIAAAGHLFAQPCTRLRVGAEGHVELVRRTPFGRQVERFAPGAIAAIEVRAGRDDEGDPYWRTFLVARDGRERLVSEGRLPEEEQALAARLRAALLLAESGAPA
jgi:hypothetical protein